MGRRALGELEQLVLLAIARLDGRAYAVSIVDEIERCTGRDVGQASIYVVLGRLENKGMLSSRVGAGASERGGRPRRYYRITPAAAAKLHESRDALRSLWDGLELKPE